MKIVRRPVKQWSWTLFQFITVGFRYWVDGVEVDRYGRPV